MLKAGVFFPSLLPLQVKRKVEAGGKKKDFSPPPLFTFDALALKKVNEDSVFTLST